MNKHVFGGVVILRKYQADQENHQGSTQMILPQKFPSIGQQL